jgi:hypothetical protein
MNPLEPIAGISLERYADLCASMRDCGGNLERCAQKAQQMGVDRQIWEAAMNGWNARMNNPTTAGAVAVAYMPLYQEALKRHGGVASAPLEDYVGMTAMINSRDKSLDKMYAHYGIDVIAWSQISTEWTQKIIKDPAFGAQFKKMCDDLITQLNAGGPLPVPSKQKGSAAPQQQQAAGPQQQQQAQQQQSGGGFAIGAKVLVTWSDCNKYPGQVAQAQQGHYLIAFPNGRQEWVPGPYLSPG